MNQLSVRFKWANQNCSLSLEPLADSLRLYIAAGFHIAMSGDAPQSRSFLFPSSLNSDWPTCTRNQLTLTIFKVELLKMLHLKFWIQLSAPPAGHFVVHSPAKDNCAVCQRVLHRDASNEPYREKCGVSADAS